ncbi:hypothetical protein E4T47_03538 [Aureobasidium subglaciale]|nr:hypothetical protein E4T47_03538 [Aureobasidium subglaciale]
MSAFKKTNDLMAELARRGLKNEPDVDMPMGFQGPPSVSFDASPDLVRIPTQRMVTWKEDRMPKRSDLPPNHLIKELILKLCTGDNLEQLETVYRSEVARAEMEECYQIRLKIAETELQQWKDFAEHTKIDLHTAKGRNDYVATGLCEAGLDKAQGKIAHWIHVVEREKKEIQGCEARLRTMERQATDALALLFNRHGRNTRYCILAYILARKESLSFLGRSHVKRNGASMLTSVDDSALHKRTVPVHSNYKLSSREGAEVVRLD